MQLVVCDFQLFLGAVDVEKWSDADEQAPPGPVADLHERANIALNASNGEFLWIGEK